MILIILMIAAGCAVALSVMIGIAAIERSGGPIPDATSAPDRNRISASILFQLLLAGGSRRRGDAVVCARLDRCGCTAEDSRPRRRCETPRHHHRISKTGCPASS